MQSQNYFSEKYTDAIKHLDDKAAKALLNNLNDFFSSQNFQNLSQTEKNSFLNAAKNLKLVALPKLSDEESQKIIKESFLDAFRLGIDMENRITLKLFMIPEIPRDSLREKMKRALMENAQKIGPLTISQWIQEFEKQFNIQSRGINASTNFIATDIRAQKLEPILKNILKETLHIYDYLLVTTLPFTGPYLEEFLDSINITDDINRTNLRTISSSQFSINSVEANQKYERLELQEALGNYPEIGEQLITSQRIKLKSFPELVRPSIKNWLADYTFTLGYDNQDPMKRMEFLFKSPNCLNLNSEDRERLGLLFKAFDEKTPVSVDTTARKIYFEKSQPERRSSEAYIPQRQATPATEIPRPNPQENFHLAPKESITPKASSQNVQSADFSFHQKMPFENEINRISPRPAGRTFDRNVLSEKNGPIVIPKDTGKPAGKNVINLKDFI